jgi:putative phosphoribosyl transferase
LRARFRDRAAAGRELAGELAEYAGRADVVVLGLPRGGVPVAFEVARALGAALDVFVVRKLGVPGQPELAFGAIATGGVRHEVDEVICADTPGYFIAVGERYDDFRDTSDEEVRTLLADATAA